ncbi:class I SAM-dependent methyltransferase [Paractinoplanes rishiriensis]|uniref:Methyltransferase n=1 Tax=Paractinoplanes rishiriensis TaxID=1050105 RepID=A0A919K2D3_9ACTN|nr:class I SAM-dependent methyltransferase [Actinoplanes rishiriensis]GIE97602.1 methyltransferase [Actinoplanes rishiriensis]
MPDSLANRSEIERWNGPAAQRWLAERERHAAIRHRLLPHLLALSRPDDVVLDVGCGCGDLTRALAGSVTGLDVSEPLLEVARRSVPGVEFRRGDAQTYPLPPAAYDLIVSSFGVMFFDDPVAAFGNLRTALRASGRLAFLCWQDPLANEIFAIPLRAFRRYGFAPDPISRDSFADPGAISAMLAEAGFAEVQVDALREPARLGSDVPDVMGYAFGSSQVRDLVAAAGPEVAARVRAEMEAEFTARTRPDGVWVEAAAYLVTARLMPA